MNVVQKDPSCGNVGHTVHCRRRVEQLMLKDETYNKCVEKVVAPRTSFQDETWSQTVTHLELSDTRVDSESASSDNHSTFQTPCQSIIGVARETKSDFRAVKWQGAKMTTWPSHLQRRNVMQETTESQKRMREDREEPQEDM